MPKTKKAFYFDLSVKEAFKHGVGASAWGKVRSFLEQNGFRHIQGSGYESKKTMSYAQAATVLNKLHLTYPWFINVAKDARLTNIGKYYNALDCIKTGNCSENELNNPKLAAEEELDVEQEEADMCTASKQLQQTSNGLTQSLGKSEH